MLRLSSYSLPQLLHGSSKLVPQNMQEAPERLQYLEGLVEYLNLLLNKTRGSEGARPSIEQVLDVYDRIPFARSLVDLTHVRGKLVARERAHARDGLSLDVDRLAVAFPDGRLRTPQSTVTLSTGKATPVVARLLAALRSGASRQALTTVAGGDVANLEAMLDRLIARRVLEELGSAEERTAPQFQAGRGDRFTWLGHASALFQSGGKTVWIDPLLSPHMVWKQDEFGRVFSPSHAEARLFEPYGPGAPQLAPYELPLPDAVCITHQDVDHIDLGVLMTLPDDVPIVVPRRSPEHPWEVDLEGLIRKVLGPERQIRVLAHGETLELGGIRVTAFPFRGEMPPALPHTWNCYLLETERSALACLADSRLAREEEEFLSSRLGGTARPLTLLAGAPLERKTGPGWRDGLTSTELYNDARLYSWYAPLWSMFQPVQVTNVSYAQLERLARRANLQHFFPYARGSAPWFRLLPGDPLYIPINSMSITDLERLEQELARSCTRPRLLPAHYGQPIRIDG
ncbi:MBL fold metallo-hydrolase [Hyalangium rubrum]|uniref:MBL fold metallo-hydrolase n=1 Tax=Hyalangium rubrum TaxID=3103134 RepID=A0ABU5HAF4_9BACT|nr:MBL fold metallo-hydrolase [Hyalangium sp. s54d21]MDY7230463.1 MBL fold metallo-hydrolase [Hyalangium sp. s54d21]